MKSALNALKKPQSLYLSIDLSFSRLHRLSKNGGSKEPPAAIGGAFPQELPEQSRVITARIIKLSPRESFRVQHCAVIEVGEEKRGWKAEMRDTIGGRLDRGNSSVGDFTISKGSRMCLRRPYVNAT